MTDHRNHREGVVHRMLAGAPHWPEQPAGPCLDAETLAAWADDTLSAGERSAAEAHAADCGKCQAMLVAMVRTLPESPPVEDSWRMPFLRWLVPLTAAAAAATLWIVAPPRQGPVPVSEVGRVTDQAQPPPASAPESGPGVSATEKAASGARSEPKAPQQRPGVDADQNAGLPSTAKVAGATPPPAAVARPERAEPAEAPAAAAPSPQAARAARSFSFGATAIVVVSSDPQSRWRILPGAVQRSSDGGATWQTQNTGVDVTLSAGASPSPSVCWLVGPGGTVLLSTDGQSWMRLPFPDMVPLVGVRAMDGERATVTTADGRELATENGGRTWARAQGR